MGKTYIGADKTFPIYEETTKIETVNITADNITDYFDVINDEEDFTFAWTDGLLRTNITKNDEYVTAKLTLVAKCKITNLTLDYDTDTVTTDAYFEICINDVCVLTTSGNDNIVGDNDTPNDGDLSYPNAINEGDTIVFMFYKGGKTAGEGGTNVETGETGESKAKISNINITADLSTKVQIGEETRSVSQQAKKIYLGVNGVAKKIKAGYIGVNGIAKKIYRVADPILANNTWKEISEIARDGTASELWNIGDQTTIIVNGVTYLVDIIGFDHDTVTDPITYGREKAGITFQLHDCLVDEYNLNNSNTNSGGWGDSVMRNTHMPALLNQLTPDLQKVIVPVDKTTLNGGNTTDIGTVSDSLFLLSEIEICGEVKNTREGEGSQYKYYNNWQEDYTCAKKTIDGQAAFWWLRSPVKGYHNAFLQVHENGYMQVSAAPSVAQGVAFAFCV